MGVNIMLADAYRRAKKLAGMTGDRVRKVFMANQRVALLLLMGLFAASRPWSLVATSEAAEAKLSMDSILQGARREGKLSWASNLVDEEVVALNKAFQKEFPFMKSVEYARMRGPEENERFLSEMQAGVFTHDMVHVGSDLIPRFQSLGFLVEQIDWSGLFKIDPRMVHPRRFGVAVANTLGGIMYSKTKVPKEHIPKTWEDCTNPFFSGKMATEVRPQQFTELATAKGEEWAVEYAKKIAANKPRWMSSGTAALTLMVAGEILMLCPTSYGTWYRQASRNPNFSVGWVFPEGTILGDRSLLLSPMKGAANPNAAILFVGWVASKGLPILDTGRESLFHPDTKLGKQLKGRPVKVEDWDTVDKAERISKRIVEVWGFPKAVK
jgi:ABC-type Fe3+ transport system substrate-binding protein